MPPVPVKSSGVLFERGDRKLGLHPFPAPLVINSQPYLGRPACVHCGFCHGFVLIRVTEFFKPHTRGNQDPPSRRSGGSSMLTP